MDSWDMSLPIISEDTIVPTNIWANSFALSLEWSHIRSFWCALPVATSQRRPIYVCIWLAEREGVLFQIFARSEGSHDTTFKYHTYWQTQKRQEMICVLTRVFQVICQSILQAWVLTPFPEDSFLYCLHSTHNCVRANTFCTYLVCRYNLHQKR